MISEEVLAMARRRRAINPRPPLTEDQERELRSLFGTLSVPGKAQRRAA